MAGDHGVWPKLTRMFRRQPRGWAFNAGDSGSPYVHRTSVLSIAFSRDDTLIALAGGGCMPGADSTIRLIDPNSKQNTRILRGHVCGIHDLSFDPETGILASASFDYSVFLWNIEKEDVIFLIGEDEQTKGHCEFSRSGSLLTIGEYAYHTAPHSFFLYDAKRQRRLMRFALPEERGVSALATSPDSNFIAIAAGRDGIDSNSKVYLVDLPMRKIMREFSLPDFGVYDLTFGRDSSEIIAGVCGGEFGCFAAGLIVLDSQSGAIRFRESLGGIGVRLAVQPEQRTKIAVGFESERIRIYDLSTWTIVAELLATNHVQHEKLCSLAFSNAGDRLAFGFSTGRFELADVSLS